MFTAGAGCGVSSEVVHERWNGEGGSQAPCSIAVRREECECSVLVVVWLLP